jgi:hypothetical protein
LNLIKYTRHVSRTTPIRQAHSKKIGETYDLKVLRTNGLNEDSQKSIKVTNAWNYSKIYGSKKAKGPKQNSQIRLRSPIPEGGIP